MNGGQNERTIQARGTRLGLISVGLAAVLSVATIAGGAARGKQLRHRRHPRPGEARLHLVADRCRRRRTSATRDKACQARVDAQNAKGGVNGRKIDLETVDDKSAGANLTAAQDLVQNRNVFAVVNNSSFAFLAYRYLKDAGRADDRRRLRRHLLLREGQREHHLRASATAPRSRAHLRHGTDR